MAGEPPRSHRNRRAASAATGPLTAADAAVGPEAGPSQTAAQKRKQEHNDNRLTKKKKAAKVGDKITWRPFESEQSKGDKLRCTAALEVIGLQGEHEVLVKRPRGEPLVIPRSHIEECYEGGNVGAESATAEGGRGRRRRQLRASLEGDGAVEGQPAKRARETVISADGFEDDGAEGSEIFAQNEIRLAKEKLGAVQSALSSYKGRASEKAVKLTGTIEGLQAALRQAYAKLEEMQAQGKQKALGKPLLGETVPIKCNGVVPDNLRDLAVDLGVQQGYPGHTVFEAVALMMEKLGGTVTDQVQHPGEMFAHCLLERSIMLEDDQARRMAEASREGEPMAIRGQERDAEATKAAEAEEAKYEAMYKAEVLDVIDPWLNYEKHNAAKYDSKRVMGNLEDIDVGDLATDEAIRQGAEKGWFGCSFLFCGVDGTSHGR